MSPLTITVSPRPQAFGTDRRRRDDPANAGGVDEHSAHLAAVDDLGVTGDETNARRDGGPAHRRDDPAQRVDGLPFLQD